MNNSYIVQRDRKWWKTQAQSESCDLDTLVNMTHKNNNQYSRKPYPDSDFHIFPL